ncbi:peptidoglycan bridge formation glycyltransferase FemA/FemB family protein [Patescibacteria group bacterium]|nr:MAG: peptidoglycan bridge formation glycyltransferase FemA/FemB family protein [Patescibacteria group bacterium]
MKTGIPPLSWDEQLERNGGSIVQSRHWAEFQDALGHQPVWQQEDDYQWLGSVWTSHGLRYLVCSYGPVLAKGADPAPAVKSLIDAGRQLGVDFIRLDPQDHRFAKELKAKGARHIADNQPSHTQVVDLTKSLDELRGDLASGHRNLINGTERRGVSIAQVSDRHNLNKFIEMLKDTARRSHTVFQDDYYFQTLWSTLQPADVAKLYVASVDGQPVAGAIFLDCGKTRSYLYAGAWQEKNRQAKASVSLVWQAMMDAKDAGMTKFDLWGIAPTDDPKHSWAGITRFKQGYGGAQVEYAGTWDIPLKPQKYRLYTVYRRLRGRQ